MITKGDISSPFHKQTVFTSEEIVIFSQENNGHLIIYYVALFVLTTNNQKFSWMLVIMQNQMPYTSVYVLSFYPHIFSWSHFTCDK